MQPFVRFILSFSLSFLLIIAAAVTITSGVYTHNEILVVGGATGLSTGVIIALHIMELASWKARNNLRLLTVILASGVIASAWGSAQPPSKEMGLINGTIILAFAIAQRTAGELNIEWIRPRHAFMRIRETAWQSAWACLIVATLTDSWAWIPFGFPMLMTMYLFMLTYRYGPRAAH